MNNSEAVEFVTVLAKAGNQRAAATVLGCSQFTVSSRMKAARAALGDDGVLTVMNAYRAVAPGAPAVLTSLDRKSPNCGVCGTLKVASPSTGELVCRPCANAATQRYKAGNAEKVKADAAVYRETNREELARKKREYDAANPEVGAAYYAANADTIKARSQAARDAKKGASTENPSGLTSVKDAQ